MKERAEIELDANLRVAVAMGGPGSEHDVSVASGEAVLEALQSANVKAEKLLIETAEIVVPKGVDVVFNTIHGTFGEDGQMQTQLEAQGAAYTGAGARTSAVAFDKALSKEKFLAADVPTPLSEILDVSDGVKMPAMGLPFVVKPPREGSSVGVHIVKDADEAMAAIEDAAKYSDDILIEQFVQGKELTVGVIDGEVLPIIHIVPRDGFYDISNKYPWMTGEGGTDYYCPADLSEEETRVVQEAALKAHQALGVEVYSRVDVLLDDTGRPYVLEANTIPGMTASSLLPKAAREVGYSFPNLCKKIIDLSLATKR